LIVRIIKGCVPTSRTWASQTSPRSGSTPSQPIVQPRLPRLGPDGCRKTRHTNPPWQVRAPACELGVGPRVQALTCSADQAQRRRSQAPAQSRHLREPAWLLFRSLSSRGFGQPARVLPAPARVLPAPAARSAVWFAQSACGLESSGLTPQANRRCQQTAGPNPLLPSCP
jgi:hypothetical protein